MKRIEFYGDFVFVKLNNQIVETPFWAHGFIFLLLLFLLVSYCNNSD